MAVTPGSTALGPQHHDQVSFQDLERSVSRHEKHNVLNGLTYLNTLPRRVPAIVRPVETRAAVANRDDPVLNPPPKGMRVEPGE
jgi:hypothetical protein